MTSSVVCQVTFHLSKDNSFTAAAVDLNSGRHHLWQVSQDLLAFFLLHRAPYMLYSAKMLVPVQ